MSDTANSSKKKWSSERCGTEKKGFSLPPTHSKPPMPPVKPPKRKGDGDEKGIDCWD